MSSLLFAAWLLASAAPPPSVAVLGFSAKEGVAAQLSDVLTENTATALRNSKRFSRVVSSADVQMLLTMEAQKQMLSCDTAGCMAEIAGALGTDLVCTGTVARLGSITVLNVRLVAAKSGQTLSAVGRTLQTQDEGQVVMALPDVVREMLDGMEKETPAVPVAAAKPVEKAEPSTESGPARKVLLGLGGVGAALALGGGGLAVVGAAVMGGTLGVTRITGSDRVVPALQAGFLGGAGLVAVAPLWVLGMGVLAAGALVGAWVAG